MKFRFKILILFLLFFPTSRNALAGNCIPSWETIRLTRQSEVDSFPINYPGCDVVEGWLIISGSNITNIDSLIYIKRINYSISFYDNSKLRSLRGLDSLSFCNNIVIDNNDSLINLTGLNNLDSTYDLSITNNDELINLIGLNNLKYATSLSIKGNDRILNLKGLNSIHEIFGLMINGNTELINLDGLQSLKLLNYFHVAYNNKLINFTGLDNITTTHQHANIFENPSLINFQGLHNWKIMTGGMLVISNNNALVNLSGLNNLESVGGLEIRGNNNLKSLEGIGNIHSMSTIISGNSIHITYNPKLCSINDLNDNLITNNLVLYVHSNPKLSCCNKINSILDKRIGAFLVMDVYNNSQGCNDTIETRIVNTSNCCSIKYTFLNDTICQGESVFFDNQTLRTSGTYYDTITVGSIDSVIVFQLTVRSKSYQIQNKNLCIGQSFNLGNGRVITTDGIYKDTIPNICDSIIEYRLSFLNNITVYQNALICKGKVYTLPKGNTVSTSGIYKDTLRSSFGCDSIITTNLIVTDPIPITNTVSICDGQSYTLPNGNSVAMAGTYTDTIRMINTCDSVVVTNLTVFPNNFTVSLNTTDTIESGNLIELIPLYVGGTAVSWNWTPASELSCTACEIPSASPVQTTQYIVKVQSADGCEDTAQTNIVVRQTGVYVPTAFTPNNDGINDVAEVFASNPKSFSMKIFNRWGELLFESDDVAVKWNGTYKSADCPADTYLYILDTTLQNDKAYHKQGAILLLR